MSILKKGTHKILIILFIAFTIAEVPNESVSAGSRTFEFRNFSDIFDKTIEVAKDFKSDDVLIAYDIDNTLLTTNQDLGSEQWFMWQEAELSKPDSLFKVATSIDALLDRNGEILFLSKMSPTEKNIPTAVRNLQLMGYRSIAITSRGVERRDATIRHLRTNHLQFGASAPESSLPSEFIPNVSEDLKADLKLNQMRPVNYVRGILFTDGQHKGAVSDVLFRSFDHMPKLVIYIDNQTKQIDRMAKVHGPKLDLVGIRYSYTDAEMDRFARSDKTEVTKAWNEFDSVRRKIFPEAKSENQSK